MSTRSLVLSCVLGFLTACGQLSVQAEPPEGPVPADAVHAEIVTPTAPADVLPRQALTEQLLYQFLVAEVAGQRGDLALSSEAYLDLARETRDPRVARRATEIAVFAKRFDVALEAAKIWLEVDPSSSRARHAIAHLFVNAGQLAAAKGHLVALLATEPNPGQGLLRLNAVFAKQDRRAALQLIKELAAPYSELPEAHFAIAQAALAAGRPEEAVAALREAERRKPGWEPGALLEGQIQLRTSKANALTFYGGFLDRYPASRDVRLAYARLLVSDNQYPAALTEFQRLRDDFPNNPEVSFAVGLLSLQLNRPEDAEKNLERAIAEGYRDPDAVRYYLGQSAERRKSPETAMAEYAQVGRGDHFVSAQTRYAALLANAKGLKEARAHLQGLTFSNPQEKAAIVQIEANMLRDAALFSEAFEVLTAALNDEPESVDLLYDHAMAAEKINRLDLLEKDLRFVIKLKPDHAHAYNALGYTLADRTDRLPEALALLEKALQFAPDDPFILDSMGWVQYRLGSLPTAVKYLERAYTLRPDPEIAAHLGEVMWAQGNRSGASDLWRSALRDNPQNEVLQGVIKKFSP